MNKVFESLNEIIEDLVISQKALDRIDNTSQKSKDFFKKWVEEHKTIIETALKELQQIKEANPSEAMECSLKLYKMVESAGNDWGFDLNKAWKYYNTIKQALLNAQAQDELIREYDLNPYELREALLLYAMYKDAYNGNPLPSLKQYKEQKRENEVLRQIIKSFFYRGCPLYQYIDKDFGLTIGVDSECSIMHLGEFKGVNLDQKLKEVLE